MSAIVVLYYMINFWKPSILVKSMDLGEYFISSSDTVLLNSLLIRWKLSITFNLLSKI